MDGLNSRKERQDCQVGISTDGASVADESGLQPQPHIRSVSKARSGDEAVAHEAWVEERAQSRDGNGGNDRNGDRNGDRESGSESGSESDRGSGSGDGDGDGDGNGSRLNAALLPVAETVLREQKEVGKKPFAEDVSDVSYRELLIFLFSLSANSIVFDFAEQLVNGGIAHGREVQHTLAAFGLATFIVRWLCSVYAPFEPIGLVLADTRQARRHIMELIFKAGAAIAAFILAVVVTPLGDLVINRIHNASDELSKHTKACLLHLVAWPLFDGLHRFHRGVMLKHGRHIKLVWVASMANAAGQVVAVLLLARLDLRNPLHLPITAVYSGIILETLVLLWGYHRYVEMKLPAVGKEPLTTAAVVKFAWPLGVVQLAQRSSRPVVNLLVNRSDPNSGFGVAVLSLVYPLAHLGYGWLNNMKPIVPTYTSSIESTMLMRSRKMRKIKRFFVLAGSLSFLLQVIILWTPLKLIILERVLAVPSDLAEAASLPLFLYSFIGIAVSFRTYCTSWATATKKTHLLASSSILRFGCVLLAGLVLPFFGVHGATMGIGCLMAGFGMETVVVVITTTRERRKFIRENSLARSAQPPGVLSAVE